MEPPKPAAPEPTWNLAPLYAGVDDPALEADLEAAQAAADGIAERLRGKVATLAPAALRDALVELERFMTRAYRPSLFAMLAFSTSTEDPAAQALQVHVRERSTDIMNRVTFFDIELKQAPAEVFDGWLEAPELSDYTHHLRRVRRTAPHTLSEPEERVIAVKALTGASAWSQLYTELTSGFRFTLPVDGAARECTLAEARALRSHPERAVRRAAHEAVLERFSQHEKVLTYLTNTLYQDHRLEIDLRRYATPMAPTILEDELVAEVVEALMSTVEAAYPVAQEYLRLKARALGLGGDFATHDLLAPYPGASRQVTWEAAQQEVLSAFEELSPAFARNARRFFDEARIDARPRAGKRDGAFCMGMVPGLEPYVLVNFTGRVEDVATLAHELGHGVHFSLAGQRQSLLRFYPTTPMAETASVFGEIVLIKRLLGKERDPVLRRQLLASRIEDSLATVMRQVMYTRWEQRAHDRRAAGVVPAAEYCDLWEAELERLYGDAARRGPLDRWGWITIPHLVQYRFYCYSYALGQLLVFALYQLWEQEGERFVPRYLDLLAAGGSDEPQKLLARAGVDLSDPGFWKRGVDVIRDMVEAFRAEVPGTM